MIPSTKSRTHLLLTPRTLAGNATVSAALLDCLGADHATIIYQCKSAINTNAVGPTLNLTHSDTTTTSSVTVAADQTVTITNGGHTRYEVDMKGKKRYLRLKVTAGTATNDDLTHSVLAITSRREDKPTATADFVASTNDAVVVA